MYEHLSGKLVSCGDGAAVIDVGGVGYQLNVPHSTVQAIRGSGQVRLFTVLRVRDEQMSLYGFATDEERRIFKRICSVAGVGPGIALSILSGIPIDDFRDAVLNERPKVLQSIKGVGKKTAERLVLELKEVLAPAGETLDRPGSGHSATSDDAVAALVALGYSPIEAERAVRKALKNLPDSAAVEDVVKVATRVTTGP